MKRLQIVDLVRSFSVLSVMGLHYFEVMPFPEGGSFSSHLAAWFGGGRLGVSLFFTVSGFLITEIITSGKPDHFHVDFKKFYIKRMGRIYPLVALMAAVGLFILSFCDMGLPMRKSFFQGPDVHEALLFWASIPLFFFNVILPLPLGTNLGAYWRILWSLAIEEQFYLAYPWVLKGLKRSRRVLIFLGILIVVGLVYRTAFTFSYPDHWIVFFNSFGYFDQIAIGSALYFVSSKMKSSPTENKFQRSILCVLGLAVMGEAYFNLGPDSSTYLNYGKILGPFFISWGCFLFLLGGLHLPFFEAKYWRWFALPGQLSYACYLFHCAVLGFLYPVLLKLSSGAGLLLYAAATLLLGYGSYVFFERPANNGVRRLFGVEKTIPLAIPGVNIIEHHH